MNSTIFDVNDDGMADRLFNDSTFPLTEPPYSNGTNDPDADPQNSALYAAFFFLLIFACLIACTVKAVCISPETANNAPQTTGQEGEETIKKCSEEDLYEAVIKKFDQLGNQTTLVERNFRMKDGVPKVLPENPICDNRDTSDDESLSQVDLEEGPADYEGFIVVNRVANDELSEEIVAPNYCAICLEKYRCGEEVVWCSNEKCQHIHHIYHKGCIATYFAHAKKKGKKKCLCPTCRQEFLVSFHGPGVQPNSTKSVDCMRHLQLPT